MNFQLITGGFDDVERSFRSLSVLAQHDNASLEVGYEAPYALVVHEDTQAYRRTGQAKYLEQPARTEEDEMRRIIRDMRSAGIPLDRALETAGHYLLRKSQELVPVDTGFLRDSGFVSVTHTG